MKTSDDFGNIVFGTSGCNTDMIRAENMVAVATRSIHTYDKKTNYAGKLTTTRKLSGTVDRKELSLKDSSAKIPAWFEKNSSEYCTSILLTSLHYLTGL